MRPSMRTRAWLLPVLALALAACGSTVPTAAPTTASPIALPSETPTPSPEPTPAPVSPSPVALEPLGVEVFSPLESGHWEMAASESNLGSITEVKVLRAITDFVEVYARCSGDGSIVVSIGVTPPASEAPFPTSQSLAQTRLDCPDTNGQSISMGGTAPAGWFASPNVTPSDPSIKYEVLVGTIVD